MNNNVFHKRALNALKRIVSDFKLLFRSDKLFILSWLRFDGARLLHNNWGDDINKFFIESISGLTVIDITTSRLYGLLPLKAYCCIGSILGNFKAKRYEVWGSGIIREEMPIDYIPQKIYSVRGPLTRQVLLKKGLECPEKYGDPALLVSRYHKPSFEKKFDIGIIPHYTDEENPVLKLFLFHHPEVLLIKMKDYDDWLDVPRQICSCKRIISSSLHGLIISDSYRVPNAWVRFSDKINGGDFKYQDYLKSVNRHISGPSLILSEADLENIIINNIFSIACVDKIDFRSIFEACPFKSKIKDYKDLIPQPSCYSSLSDKEENYCSNGYINSKEELDKLIIRLQALEESYIYRGVSEAKYKMYASSQRHWLQKTDWVARMGQSSYYSFIEEIIRRTERLNDVLRYMQQQSVQSNDMFIMALMQHFEAPSPMIDFSESLLTGLFFASDWDDEKWSDSGQNRIDDYVSLYFISKKFDWVDSSVQTIMQSVAEILQQRISDTLKAGIELVTEETEDNIRRLLYRQFRLDSDQSDITFIPLGGPSLGTINIDIPIINFHCEYVIINDRIVRQQGMFIMNNTINDPLVEVMNKQSHNKMFHCVNIHKSLLPYMRSKYLIPNGRTHELIYENDNQQVKMMLQAIRSLS